MEFGNKLQYLELKTIYQWIYTRFIILLIYTIFITTSLLLRIINYACNFNNKWINEYSFLIYTIHILFMATFVWHWIWYERTIAA